MNVGDNNNPKIAKKDYLWDRCGSPDPEIEHLEALLAAFRHNERPLGFPTASLGSRSAYVPGNFGRLAAAAVVLLAVTASLFFAFRPATAPPDATSTWDVSNLQGATQIGSQILSGDHSGAKLHVGQTLTTDYSSRASLSENDLGEIQVEPNSRLRLLQSGPQRKRIQLDVGTIRAAIWAPPTQFVVDTPSAIAVDLGCAYTLQVAPDGSGTIRTTLGWVGFHLNGRDSFIPAGAMCSTRPKVGPGTPYFEDASPQFREALANFNNSKASDGSLSPQLGIILREARSKDALTLWHLLSRTTGPERAQVYDRLATLVPPPAGVTRTRTLELDPNMLDLYWNALNLGDISIWRFWEQSSSPNATPSTQLPVADSP